MPRPDVYQQVTDRIIQALESGTVPWRQPWVGGGPVNVRTGRPYRGVNIFLLGLMPYGDPRWGTYKAVKESGGHVRRGEKATHVILWKPVKRELPGESGEMQDAGYMLLRSYSVFNAEQCEGLPELVTEYEHDPIEQAEKLALSYIGPTVVIDGGEASYSQTTDTVRCPEIGQFEKVDAYYSTLYHELVHSTGHKSRLDRLESGGFGTGPYAKEELVAEMGAAMLCGVVGIENLDQSSAYVEHWLGRLRGDPKLVIGAAAQAQKAADLILGTTFESSQVPEMAVAA